MTGWAIPGVRIRVVERRARCPPGRRADRRDRRPGNTVMDGYYRDAEATAAAIRDGWFHTGDMATIDE